VAGAPRVCLPPGLDSNATISLAYGGASLLFHSAAGRLAAAGPRTASHAAMWAGVVAGCGASAWVINHGLLLAAVKMTDSQVRARDLVATRDSVTSDLVELSLAVVVSLVAAVSWYLLPFTVLPVAMYRRYMMAAQLQAHARTDAATGLLNANTWQQEAELELAEARRHSTSLAVAMARIDHLGDVGGPAGSQMRDQVLRHIAYLLKDRLPGHCVAGRLGSEEFAILLPRASRERAQQISERLRDQVAAEPIVVESGTSEGFVLRPTVSIGVASLSESRPTLAELVTASHEALGQARSTGWSKVYVCSDESSQP
jgi:diguanylate cyclase (GGDEF)-like protein